MTKVFLNTMLPIGENRLRLNIKKESILFVLSSACTIFALMKRLPLVILALGIVLVAVVAGCGRTPRYDGRLVAADSLMRSVPDSALAIVEGVCHDSLAAQGDRAYRDLLLTQARYRCYITATSDSDINRALAYYRAHPKEREKLTRAYIYKGAVMEELGHPDSAMLHYKHAEATAAPDDYFNLGYAKLRIGELYQELISQDSLAITRLYEAKHYFEILKDTNYIIAVNGLLGAISGVHCPDSTRAFLTDCINLSQQFDSSLQYTYKSKLAGLYLYEKDYRRANQLAMDVFYNGKQFCQENQFYYYASMSFVKLGLTDSAKFIVTNFSELSDAVDSMNYYNIMAEIAKAEDKPNDYAKYLKLSKDITSRIIADKQNPVALHAELDFDNQQLENKNQLSRRIIKTLNVLGIVALLIILFFIYLNVRLRNLLKRHEEEKLEIKQELESSLAELHNSLDSEKSQMASKLLSYRMSAFQEIYQNLRFKSMDTNKAKKIVPLSSVLASMNERFELLDIQLSDSFWEKMRLSVDAEYNGIITFVEKKYNSLTEKDMRVFCLLCAKVTPQIIKLCMNFTNSRTVSNYRNKLIKRKIGMDITFDEFIEAYLRGDLN